MPDAVYAPPELPLGMRVETERCTLRTLTLADAPFIWSAVQTRSLVRGLGWRTFAGLPEVEKDIAEERRAWQKGSRLVWTVLEKASAQPLGGGTLSWLSTEPDSASWLLAYWIHPDAQGQGYATEAARALLDVCFSKLAATHVWAGCAPWNRSSERVLQKLGFDFVEQNPRGYLFENKPVLTNEYLLTKETWAQG